MFTKKLEYAYILLKALKNSTLENPLLGKDIIEKLNIPRSMAAGILTELSNARLVMGKKGKLGGYYISRENISLYDIFLAVEGDNVKLTFHDHDYRAIMFQLSHKVLKEMQNIIIWE